MADDVGNLHSQSAEIGPVGLYLVKLEVGNVGTPGAPIVNLALTVDAPSGNVSGIAEISQAIVGGNHRFPVSGHIYQTGFGQAELLVSLTGEFVYSVPPPAIGSFLAKFKAALVVDKSWNGKGGFDYLNVHVENVPVKNVSA
ncbi:hypothetical protein SGCZBJ_17030 [Caulobacter zeae]|uniref:DUF1842 domain-containing protein n=1 Tax=Caulobacter zeae TaxID=2055137 RepID=A0A2N5DA01_9CAUL|nr:DUF1842 domain-containing protein [Caulobacter zeae]PLR22877.1 hypothetical protein SGCZBJ_17030 [Caulobacter zeae]